MGYRIDYQPVRKIRGAEKRRSRRAALTGVFFLLFLFGVQILWQEGGQVLRGLLFPGDAAVTAAAMEDLVQQLGAGVRVGEALELFCRRIMEGSGIAAN